MELRDPAVVDRCRCHWGDGRAGCDRRQRNRGRAGLLGRDDEGADRLGPGRQGLVHELELVQELFDLTASGHGRAHRQLGHHGDVAQPQRIGGIGDGHDESAVAGEADRRRLVATSGRLSKNAGGAAVNRVLVEVDVVQRVALGQRPRKLIGADRIAVEQDLLRSHAGPSRRFHSLIGHALLHEAELDEDVREEAPPSAAQRGSGHSGPGQRATCHRGGRGLRAHAASSVAGSPSGATCCPALAALSAS